MSHEMLRVTKASAEQLDLAMAGIVGGGLLIAILMFLLLKWSRKKEAERGKARRARTRSSPRARRRSG